MKLLEALRPPRQPAAQRMNLADAYFAAGGQFGGFGGFTTFSVGGQTYTVPVSTTMPGQKSESIANSFEGFCLGGLAGNSVIFGLASIRLRVFSEARFQYQRMSKGRPADLWGDKSLRILETPWPGGVTGDLLALMLLHADFAGNAYVANVNGQLACLRPDWVEILLAGRRWTDGTGYRGTVGMEKAGYLYYQGGKATGIKPTWFGPEEVAHFAPMPDPMASYRGMSWLTPIIREIRADNAGVDYKLNYLNNSATPNLAVSLKEITDPDQFKKFVDMMDDSHKGVENAGATLYLGGGADVTVIGSNLKDMDFGNVTSRGETRLALAAGVPPTVACLSEGLQGSSLNAGNFGQARRQFADMTMFPLWRNAAGSLATLVSPPDPSSRLWFDARDVPFLREDQKDLAAIQQQKAQAVRELFMAGFTPDSIVAAVTADDLSLLVHTGTFSIQVQTPGTTSTKMPSTIDEPPLSPEGPGQASEKPAGTAVGPAPANPNPPALAASAAGNGNGKK